MTEPTSPGVEWGEVGTNSPTYRLGCRAGMERAAQIAASVRAVIVEPIGANDQIAAETMQKIVDWQMAQPYVAAIRGEMEEKK